MRGDNADGGLLRARGVVSQAPLGPLVQAGRVRGGLGAALHAELRQHVGHVVLDGLLGQVHRCRNLPVGLTIGDEIQNSTLLRREAGEARVDLGALAQAGQDPLGKNRIEKGLAGGDTSDCVDEICVLDLLQDISRSAGHDGGKERLVVGIRREHHTSNFRCTGPDLTTDFDTASIRESDVENGHVRTGGRDPGQRLGHSGRLTHDFDVLARLEQRPKAGSDDFMVIEEEDAQSHLVILPIAPRQGNPSPTTADSPLATGERRHGGLVARDCVITSLDSFLVPFRSIEDPVKLRRVLEATLLLEADLELPSLLRHFIEEACSMTGARYGALGVLDDDHTALAEFVTVGLDPEEERRIGARPTGRGVLGLLIRDPRPLRLSNLGTHDESVGFPPNHPPMTSFLGVPIKVRGEVYGNLYLTDKVGWSEFTRDDEALVEALALAAAIAIENARLHQRVQEVAVYEDRDRVARDLHDTVIQRLFAVTLSLQSMAGAADAAGMADRLKEAVSNLDATIRQVRSTIYELGSAGIVQGVRATVLALIRELNSVVGVEVRTSIDGPVDAAISDEMAEHLYATVREALTNVGRHAQASEVSVNLSVKGDSCVLQVRDNGRGLTDSEGGEVGEGGLGLVNLRRRAEKLHGQLVIETLDSGGTLLTWQVPINH